MINSQSNSNYRTTFIIRFIQLTLLRWTWSCSRTRTHTHPISMRANLKFGEFRKKSEFHYIIHCVKWKYIVWCVQWAWWNRWNDESEFICMCCVIPCWLFLSRWSRSIITLQSFRQILCVCAPNSKLLIFYSLHCCVSPIWTFEHKKM